MLRIKNAFGEFSVLFKMEQVERMTTKGFEIVNITRCLILKFSDRDTFIQHATGIAVQRPDDPNNPTLGKERALGNALRKCPKEQRKPFWDAFRAATGPQSEPTIVPKKVITDYAVEQPNRTLKFLTKEQRDKVMDIEQQIKKCQRSRAAAGNTNGCVVCDGLNQQKEEILAA